jgi:hypothetical protein
MLALFTYHAGDFPPKSVITIAEVQEIGNGHEDARLFRKLHVTPAEGVRQISDGRHRRVLALKKKPLGIPGLIKRDGNSKSQRFAETERKSEHESKTGKASCEF